MGWYRYHRRLYHWHRHNAGLWMAVGAGMPLARSLVKPLILPPPPLAGGRCRAQSIDPADPGGGAERGLVFHSHDPEPDADNPQDQGIGADHPSRVFPARMPPLRWSHPSQEPTQKTPMCAGNPPNEIQAQSAGNPNHRPNRFFPSAGANCGGECETEPKWEHGPVRIENGSGQNVDAHQHGVVDEHAGVKSGGKVAGLDL